MTVDDDENQRCYLDIVSYNMHGFNQGISTVRDMIMLFKCPIFLLQEHWLAPFNLYRFNDDLPADYLCFGSSAMGSCIESGVVRGRPYGGVMTLVHKSLQKCTQIVCSDERFVIVIGNALIVNVYLPCSGSENRLFTYQEVLENITLWIDHYTDKAVIFGGDLNLNLESRDVFCDLN